MARVIVDLTAKRFGRLVVRGKAPSRNRQTTWACICDCGKELTVSGCHLINGRSTSCGCYRSELLRVVKRKHGLSHSRTYNSWVNMKARSTKPDHPRAADYALRGVDCCPAWAEDFRNFLADMGECPPGYTLERKDNDRGYWPDNCKWATYKEQANNRRPARRRRSV
jgi:hypothetical protein